MTSILVRCVIVNRNFRGPESSVKTFKTKKKNIPIADILHVRLLKFVTDRKPRLYSVGD